MEKRLELVFIPSPAVGHMASAIEMAKRLINREPHRISITILQIKRPSSPHFNTYLDSISSIFPDIRFILLPHIDPPPVTGVALETFVSLFIENYKPYVKNAITQLISSDSSVRLAGLVIDILYTTLIDVANEFHVPTYLYIPTNASFLGLMLHLPLLHTQFTADFSKGSETELKIPSFANSFPPNVLPSTLLNKHDDNDEGYRWYMYHARRYRETKGILVNTFAELEPTAFDSFADDGQTPPVYPVGPVLDLEGKGQLQCDEAQREKIMKWLNDQPPSSVVLLSFGSLGGFRNPLQVKEIADGLEMSGHRFLWSLRNPAGIGEEESAELDPRDALPEGFERRVGERGLVVCEWVPQVEVLGHEAIGGFVSHCGWNSILESLWFGVPIATWPMYGEQQLNAFLTVREMGLAVEMRLEYRMSGGDVVRAEEVERGVKMVMERESEVRRRVAQMREKGRAAVVDGGSSFAYLGHFIEDVIAGCT